MSYAAIGTALAGQIPLITMAGVTIKYKEAMLGGLPKKSQRARPKARRKSRRNALGGISPF